MATGIVRRFFHRLFPNTNQPHTTLDPQVIAKISALEPRIGHTIHNFEIFHQALVHRSSLHRTSKNVLSNERLEFLGDSVLNLIVAEHLFHLSPDAEEGELTKVRSRLVNRKALAAYAKEIGLSEFVLMSASAAQTRGRGGDTIIADTYEALIAAIYLDAGYEAAKRFVKRQVLATTRSGIVVTRDENYKSMLLEYSQGRGLGTPRYAVVKQEGPDHDRTFTVEVSLNNKHAGTGKGKNKKEAEQAAADDALSSLR